LNRALLLSISILLIIVSFPGGGLPLMVCFAVAPALIATAKLKPLQSALTLGGWAWLWWLITLWWAVPSLMAFSNTSGLVSIIITSLVCFTLALPYALSAFLIAYFNLWHSRLTLIQIPLCFAVLTSLLSSILPAAPVNALFEYPILLQWADIGGLPLLVFFYFAFNAAIAFIVIHKKNSYPTAISVLILIPVLVLAYGHYKLSEQAKAPITTITAGYIQPVANAENKLSDLIAQSSKLKEEAEQLELVIWPEVPIDFSWHDQVYERYRIRKLAQELDSHLIILSGYHYANAKNAEDGHFNSADFISSKGEDLAEYRKQRLVPFFEYLPFKTYLAPYFPSVKNYIAGEKPVPFQYKDRILAPLICYEALFTDLVRSYIDEGADIIINPGNDGWFGEQGALSHLSLALLRTIEYRIPLIRVNNSGVSTVINHKGEILFDTLSSLNIKTGKVFNLEITNSKPTF
jgi:apolipoprotein N-acyltransferase